MTNERAVYERVNAEFWSNAQEIDELDTLRSDLDTNHFCDEDYAEKRAALDARREELVTKSREIGAQLKAAKNALCKDHPINALLASFRK